MIKFIITSQLQTMSRFLKLFGRNPLKLVGRFQWHSKSGKVGTYQIHYTSLIGEFNKIYMK